MISNDDETPEGFLPHDFLTGIDGHAFIGIGHGQNHHGVITVVHGVDFVAIKVGYRSGSLLNHRDVDGICNGTDVRDFLAGKDALERETGFCRAVLPWLGFGDAQDFVGFVIDDTKPSNFERSNFYTVGSRHGIPSEVPLEPWLMTLGEHCHGSLQLSDVEALT